VTEADFAAYHTVGWLPGGVISSTSDLEFLTVGQTTTVCFESHLIAELDLPPSKFLVSILNFLRCKLVHLNPNAIAALSCFSMLCEWCLGIPPDTSLFWYFYSPTPYDKQVFSKIGLSLCRPHRNEYLDATFKGCWKGASRKWFLIDTHIEPQWMNKHLLPSHLIALEKSSGLYLVLYV
jgi:hypothetical protein